MEQIRFESRGVEDIWFSWGGDGRDEAWIGAMCAFSSEPLGNWPGGRGFSKGTLKDEGLGDSTKVLPAFASASSGVIFVSTLSSE